MNYKTAIALSLAVASVSWLTGCDRIDDAVMEKARQDSYDLLYSDESPLPDHTIDLRWTGTAWSTADPYLMEVGEPTAPDLVASSMEAGECPPDIENPIPVPLGMTTRFLITSNSGIALLCLPQFGLETSAVPGILNEHSFEARPEDYSVGDLICGQCSGSGDEFEETPTIAIIFTDSENVVLQP